MSDRTRTVLSWTVLCVLALAGACFAAIHEPGVEADQSVGERRPSISRAAGAPGVVRKLRGRHEVRDSRELRGPEAEGDDAPRRRDLRGLARDRARAELVARRFFAAFARYELGGVDRSVKGELRRTATETLARKLVASPPRVAGVEERPAAGELVGLQFVAGASDNRGRRLRTAELVGLVAREGVRSPIAIELVRSADGWRVSGIGR